MYSGQEPEFIEGNVFRTIVPLSEVATAKAGPSPSTTDVNEANTKTGTEAVSTDVSIEAVSTKAASTGVKVKLSPDKLENLLHYCQTPRTRSEMQLFCGIKTETYFREKMLQPMITSGLVKRTIPDKPKSPKQKIRQSLKKPPGPAASFAASPGVFFFLIHCHVN